MDAAENLFSYLTCVLSWSRANFGPQFVFLFNFFSALFESRGELHTMGPNKPSKFFCEDCNRQGIKSISSVRAGAESEKKNVARPPPFTGEKIFLSPLTCWVGWDNSTNPSIIVSVIFDPRRFYLIW